MKFTHFLIFISFLLTACVERGKVEVSGLESATPSVTDVNVKDGKLHLKGSALHSAKKVHIDDTSLQIESQSESSLVASATEALSLTTSAVFELVISNAQGSSTYPIQLVISDGDVTTAKIADKAVTGDKIADMGAMSGQILKYNGTSWSPADLNSLVYAGTWDPNSDSEPSSSPVGGDFWIVDADGAYDLGDGNGEREWRIGDWIVYNSFTNEWDQVISSQSVVSFNGRAGEVVPKDNDYTWDQIDKTTAPIDDLSDVDTSTVAPANGEVLKWDGDNWIPQADEDSGGEITEVSAGTGLSGGGTQGTVTLNVNVGTSDGEIPQLDSTGLLLNTVIPELDTSKITSGVMDQERLPYASGTQDGIITQEEHQKLNSTDTTLSGGAAGEYLDGDGNWYTLDNTAVGLGNVTNDEQIPMSNLDTNTALGTDDTLVPSQNAVKTYVDDSVSTASNDYLLRDGSQAMTGNFDGGGNDLTNVGSLTTNNQAGATLNPFGANGGETGELRFMELETNGTNYLGFKAPDNLPANLVWRLPASDGASGEALVTDGSGALSWAGSLPPSGEAKGELSGSYPAPEIADGVIDSANLMTDSVTSAEIAADAVGTSEIATDGVDSAEIATGAVNTDELAASSVTSGKIADGEILDADVDANANIAATKLGTGVVDNTEFDYLDGVTGDIQTQLDEKLDLAGGDMTGPLTVPGNDFTVGTNQITTSGGNVGIGTGSPSSKLDVNGNIKANRLFGDFQVSGKKQFGGDYVTPHDVGRANSLLIGGYSSGGEGNFMFFQQDAGTSSTYCGGSNASDCLVLNMTDNNQTDQDGGFIIGETGSDDTFEPISIFKGNGNVGIGTSSPSNRLQVDGNIRQSSGFLRAGDHSGDGVKLVAGRYASGNPYITMSTAGGDSRMEINSGNGFPTHFLGSSDYAFTNGGNVGIGTTTPRSKLDIDGALTLGKNGGTTSTITFPAQTNDPGYIKHFENSDDSEMRFSVSDNTSSQDSFRFGSENGGVFTEAFEIRANGNIIADGTSVHSSDARLKENISPLKHSSEKLLNIDGVSYFWKQNHKSQRKQIGVIAQRVKEVYPELVTKDPDTGYLAVNYDALVAPLIEAFKDSYHKNQEQDREIAALESEVKNLKKENQKLKERLNRIEALIEKSSGLSTP